MTFPEFKSFGEIKKFGTIKFSITQKIHGSNATILIWLNEDKGALNLFSGRMLDAVFKDAAIGIRVTCPELEFHARFLGIRCGEDGRLEVADVVALIDHVVAESVARVPEDAREIVFSLTGEANTPACHAPAGLEDMPRAMSLR